MISDGPSLAELRSSDPEVRRRATSELAGFDAAAVAEQVALALADEDWRVRKEAVAVAVTLAPSPVMLSHLVRAMFTPDNVGLCNAAVEALGGFGQAAVDALGSALPRLDSDGRKLAVEALGRGAQPSALKVLGPLLRDPDLNLRVAVVEAITSIGAGGVSEATPLLSSCLGSEEPLLALAALEGLNTLGVALPWPSVARLLEHSTLRRSALLAAGRTGAPEAVPVLFEAFSAARGSLLGEVVCALRDLLRNDSALERIRQLASQIPQEARARLLALIADEDTREPVRRAAFVLAGAFELGEAAEYAVSALGDDFYLADAHEGLSLLGGSAGQALVQGTESLDPLVRASCFGLLARASGGAVASAALSVARTGLHDNSAEVRCEALGVIASLGDQSCFAPVVARLAAEELPETIAAAEAALRKLAQRHPAAARALFARAEPDAPSAHAACVVSPLLATAVEDAATLAFLTAALSNSSREVRRAAIEALSDLGAHAGVDAIAFALADEEREVREVAVAALGRIRDPEGGTPGVRHLVPLVERSGEPELVARAVRALGEAGDLHVLPVLKPLTRSSHPFVAVSAVEALAALAGPRKLEVLLDGLVHGDAEVVKATLLALSEMPDPRVVAHLGACLDHDAWDVRRLAADLLGRLSGEPAHGLLRARLASEDSPPVQAAIARALERLAGLRKSTPPPGGGTSR